MINIYFDTTQTALKYLKDTEADIFHVLVMAGDFNIRNSIWDLLFSFHSIHSDLLTDIADSLDFSLLKFTNQVSTRYLNNI